MKTLIDMAREANDYATAALGVNAIPREWRALRDKQFAALVREDDAERIAILEQDNANCRKAVSDLMDDIQKQRAAMQMALEALEDLVNGWKYIRSSYGDLYGVGWDRAEGKGDTAITALREALAQPQGEWVDLTDDEILTAANVSQEDIYDLDLLNVLSDVRAIIAKFKEKNTPPVVPQVVTKGNASEVRSTETGEWVDLTDDELKTLHHIEEFGLFCDVDEFNDISKTVIAKFKEKNTPPSAALPVPDHLPDATKKVEPPKLRRAGSFGD